MGATTGISWTGATWNPWHGCHKVSQGCKNCYMYSDKERYGQDPSVVIRAKDATFYAPLKWEQEAIRGKRQGHDRLVFTCSWSDFFVEEADAWRDEALAIMALTPHLTYQVLTKRPERMYAYLASGEIPSRTIKIIDAMVPLIGNNGRFVGQFPTKHIGDRVHFLPLPNVWLGCSVENQATANERIPWLLKAPAYMRFISYEPALEDVDFRLEDCWIDEDCYEACERISWIICGGESGPNARPCDIAWLRSCVAQCRDTGVACFVKQLGARPYEVSEFDATHPIKATDRKGADLSEWPSDLRVQEIPQRT